MACFVVNTTQQIPYVCLCDSAVDRAALTPEARKAYLDDPRPDTLPLKPGQTPDRWVVHPVSPYDMTRLNGRRTDLLDIESDPPKVRDLTGLRLLEWDVAAAGVVSKNGTPIDADGLRCHDEAVIRELSDLISSVSTMSQADAGN